MKIGIVGLYYENNLGDPLLMESTKYLLNKVNKGDKLQFEKIDFLGRDSGEQKLSFPFRAIRKASKKINEKTQQRVINIGFDLFEKKGLKLFFRKKMQSVDVIVFCGGGIINYRHDRHFHKYISSLVEVAEEMSIPVVFNSVGIEHGYDESFPNCKVFKKAFHSPVVKQISTRDDLDSLKEYTKGSETDILLTADSVTWIDELIKPHDTKTGIVGIGVIQPAIFERYKYSGYKSLYLEEIYKIVRLLVDYQVKFKLFTNGDKNDYEFANKICDDLSLNKRLILTPRATEPIELVNQINQFDSILCSRLHACIIGYSLDIPTFGIDWNGKLSFFGDVTGFNERYRFPNELDEDFLKRFLDSPGIKMDSKLRSSYRETELLALEKALSYGRKK